jgi:hypothetical protein
MHIKSRRSLVAAVQTMSTTAAEGIRRVNVALMAFKGGAEHGTGAELADAVGALTELNVRGMGAMARAIEEAMLLEEGSV